MTTTVQTSILLLPSITSLISHSSNNQPLKPLNKLLPNLNLISNPHNRIFHQQMPRRHGRQLFPCLRPFPSLMRPITILLLPNKHLLVKRTGRESHLLWVVIRAPDEGGTAVVAEAAVNARGGLEFGVGFFGRLGDLGRWRNMAMR